MGSDWCQTLIGPELFTPGLLLLINEADILLSTGQFGEAAKVHLDAISNYAFLALYVKTKGKYKEAEELEGDLTELERVRGRTEKERNAGCGECDSDIKRSKESNGVEVRRWRAECVLDAGDVDGAVGDWTRLYHFLAHIFHLAHPYLPPSPTPMTTLKQSLHSDPDSKSCLGLHRLCKALNKSFFALDELLVKEDQRAVLKLLTDMRRKVDLWNQWEAAMNPNVGEGRERISCSSLRRYSNPPIIISNSNTALVVAPHSPLLFACSSSSLRSGSPTPPTSPLGNQDANKLTITNNGGDVVPVQPFSSGEAVVRSIERPIAPPMRV
ncbi:hypothetical protein BJ165DRAFT_1406875 [Panaeolus papilionaceus]|nr:hypothetical protein BJ165DRAFT_1406875 [Panaeolus papilionaceus]